MHIYAHTSFYAVKAKAKREAGKENYRAYDKGEEGTQPWVTQYNTEAMHYVYSFPFLDAFGF